MARGDAVYSRGNVDWPLDPQCQGLPNNDCRWLHEILWRMAVKERTATIPAKYSARWLAWAANITEDDVRAYVKVLAAADLIDIDLSGRIHVRGVLNNHARLGFKETADPQTLPLEQVLSDQWEWGKPSAPNPPHTGPVTPHIIPVAPHTGPNERERERETEKEKSFYPETPAASAGLPPVPPVSPPKADPKPTPPPPDPVLDAPAKGVTPFPCDGHPTTWTPTERKVREWEETYKTLDVRPVLRQSWQWLQDHPSRRKTAAGMARFCSDWLARATARNVHRKPPPPPPPPPGGAAAKVANDPFVALCHALQARYPHKSKQEISTMAEEEMQRQRAQDARKREGSATPMTKTPLSELVQAETRKAQ